MKKDTYRTITKPSKEVLFKERRSKFFGYAFPVTTEEAIKEHLEIVKKQHPTARHWCYAWQLGKSYEGYRANDDGEPANSAGMPIYGQLQSFELTNILLVVVRYFGGTKLGVGGLIQAYKTTAQWALEASEIIEKTIDEEFLIVFDYPEMNTVMRIIKETQVAIVTQQMGITCEMVISVRKKEAERVSQLFENSYKVSIKKWDH
ncbi:MAG: YigZ family protein [Flavobacteriaceae bacterium]